LIEKAEFDFIYGSPEQFVGDLKWRSILKSSQFQEKMKAIVVSYTVLTLLKSKVQKSQHTTQEKLLGLTRMSTTFHFPSSCQQKIDSRL
jgi:negative regulator of replication initiation